MKTATLDNPARPANAVTRPALKWRIISTLLSTVGRLSAGIDIGYRHGFDSGIMLDRVYENRASGRYLVGRVIDRFYLDTLGWRAIRARRQLLKRILHDEIDRALDRPERRVVLLDVASGPGRYLLELCQEMKASDSALDLSERLSVICRDLSLPALEQGRALARSAGVQNIRYEPGDAVDGASLATVNPRPHIVVVSGLYELFTDHTLISTSMSCIFDILMPGGRLVFTTQVTHPQLEFIANVLVNRNGEPWVMLCRSIAEVEALAAQAGFTVLQSTTEPLGLFAVTTCEKPQNPSTHPPEAGR